MDQIDLFENYLYEIILAKCILVFVFTWSYKYFLWIIISCMKPYNCVQIICIKNSYLKL